MNTSLEKFSVLFNKVIKNSPNIVSSLDISKPLTQEEIERFEKKLQLYLPESYKIFLMTYGELGIFADEFLGSIYNPEGTLNSREISKYPEAAKYPNSLITVYQLGDGEEFCLDTSKMKGNECPVIAWPSYNYDGNGNYDFISENFGDFLLETVWNALIRKGIDLSQYQHLKPENRGWNYNEKLSKTS